MICSAIIVAAGSSRRMGFDKLTAKIAGKEVLQYSIEAFLRCPEIAEVIVVTDRERFGLCLPGTLEKPVTRVDGGKERHHSVMNGLRACREDSDIIAVHDGARPLIQPESIQLCLQAAQSFDAATCARRITETVKRADDEDFVSEAVSRENLWAMETPQCFSSTLLKGAYQNVNENSLLVTDEVSALESIGRKTRLISHGSANIKITYPEDILLAEKLLA